MYIPIRRIIKVKKGNGGGEHAHNNTQKNKNTNSPWSHQLAGDTGAYIHRVHRDIISRREGKKGRGMKTRDRKQGFLEKNIRIFLKTP